MKKVLKDPFLLVEEAIKAKPGSISEDSAWGIHPYWDSLAQVAVIVAIEKNYDISISDSESEKYSNMKAIIELHRKLQECK